MAGIIHRKKMYPEIAMCSASGKRLVTSTQRWWVINWNPVNSYEQPDTHLNRIWNVISAGEDEIHDILARNVQVLLIFSDILVSLNFSRVDFVEYVAEAVSGNLFKGRRKASQKLVA